MSGIAGAFGQNADRNLVQKMLGKITHRGPDDRHVLDGPSFAIGCCEVKSGKKRTRAHAGGTERALVFDGLVFNDPHSDKSDADVLWDLLDRHNKDALGRVDGTFAIAVADGRELTLARDHVGAKPILYGSKEGTTYFASEVKALQGLVDEVTELPAGKYLSTSTGLHDFPMFTPEIPSFETPEEAQVVLRELLFKATEDRMHDGAVGGSGMSGGLDSSVIAAIAYTIEPGIPLFTVGLKGSEDIANARLMAEHLGASDRHHVWVITEEDIEQAVRDAVYYLESFEEDCISGTIANMLTSRLASRHTNCCLSGEGSDELFGGYHLLKQIADLNKRKTSMDRLVAIAYNTALRRLDRGWLAHSVNYRTPFLDSRVIAFANAIPIDWKVHEPEQTEKWIVREAFRDLLPEPIANRPKLRFSAGTGVDDLMDRIARKHVSEEEFSTSTRTAAGFALESAKELWYYKIFKELFPEPGYEGQVDRWDPFKA